MFFTAKHFSSIGQDAERMEFEARLKRRFDLEAPACYQAAGLETPFLADHAACARVLSQASGLLEEIEDGRHAGPVDGPDCLIESAADFLDELKSRV
ncbi:MAG TPA: hypothetical protein VMV75_11095 [Sulfuricella sp.]|nr:hypothetical protein [Sulfuricella sp.]